ncbi:MAG TPA: hypothetical protein VKS79_09470 [Gemmataceae bacterium]|nr:hypothetical protein [Gemmataceae bacterium]
MLLYYGCLARRASALLEEEGGMNLPVFARCPCKDARPDARFFTWLRGTTPGPLPQRVDRTSLAVCAGRPQKNRQ